MAGDHAARPRWSARTFLLSLASCAGPSAVLPDVPPPSGTEAAALGCYRLVASSWTDVRTGDPITLEGEEFVIPQLVRLRPEVYFQHRSGMVDRQMTLPSGGANPASAFAHWSQIRGTDSLAISLLAGHTGVRLILAFLADSVEGRAEDVWDFKRPSATAHVRGWRVGCDVQEGEDETEPSRRACCAENRRPSPWR